MIRVLQIVYGQNAVLTEACCICMLQVSTAGSSGGTNDNAGGQDLPDGACRINLALAHTGDAKPGDVDDAASGNLISTGYPTPLLPPPSVTHPTAPPSLQVSYAPSTSPA